MKAHVSWVFFKREYDPLYKICTYDKQKKNNIKNNKSLLNVIGISFYKDGEIVNVSHECLISTESFRSNIEWQAPEKNAIYVLSKSFRSLTLSITIRGTYEK